jgi:hypothetical protein
VIPKAHAAKDPKVKNELTKAQKRRFYDKFGANAEKPRGWDWVQIISHVSVNTFMMFLDFNFGI